MKLLAKPTLITATVIYLLALFPSIMFAPFVVFLYDSGETSFILNVFAILWVIFPASLVVSILGSWLINTYKKINKDRFLTLFLLLPIIHAVLIVILGLFYFAE